MKFSIITINLNGQEGLKRTIQSINCQTHPFVEHVIVDGGSIDGSVELVKTSTRLGNWRSAEDKGIANAFNVGTRLATGEWVCYLNSGDLFFSNDTLTRVAQAIASQSTQGPRVYFGDFVCVTGNERFLTKASANPEGFEWSNPLNHQSVFLPRELALQEPYDEDLDLAMDYDLWLRLLPKAEFVRLDFPIAVFAGEGRSSSPSWALHNLVMRRAIWHKRNRKRISWQDFFKLIGKSVRLQAELGIRRLLGRRIIRFLKKFGVRKDRDRFTPMSP